ncbi:MAG: DNA mismatch repair protein MutS, partial [Oscillospiraceae bacterium]|nr:DNA mismatch repair protein MutS [Candidatus Equicaccousia limihippi]
EQEKEKTGIKTLKVKYNRVFGYYIEVSKSFIDKVPADYIRKQTLTNCERYITEELKLVEGRILGSKEKAIALEYKIFEDIRKTVAANFERLKRTGNAISLLDAFLSLANVAANNRYVRPALNTKGIISIKDGRHPVVEQLSKEPFVANDTLLDNGDNRCAIITGPNMAGKSTYMRQVAIISLLTQIGSFVPATFADMSIVDAIFTRVGASDDLAMGQSTFMVEMSEVADIIKYATKNSLIILDEIGRGTSTFDGMSIARSVLEYIADRKKIGAKTLFATHYHELTVMENLLDGVKNYNIAVKKRGDDITFLRRIVRGYADDSYGIEVAKLSGIPTAVIDRAKEILKDTEEGKTVEIKQNIVDFSDQGQMSLFGQNNEIVEQLQNIDVNTLTPIEALKILYELSDKAKK